MSLELKDAVQTSGSDEESACYAGDPGLTSGLGRSPVFLPGKSHGQRSLASYSPWCYKEADTAEQLSTVHTSELCFRMLSKAMYLLSPLLPSCGQNRLPVFGEGCLVFFCIFSSLTLSANSVWHCRVKIQENGKVRKKVGKVLMWLLTGNAVNCLHAFWSFQMFRADPFLCVVGLGFWGPPSGLLL